MFKVDNNESRGSSMVFAPLSSKLTFACSKSPIKTLEKGVKYVLKVNNKNIFEHILVLVTRS